MTVLQQTLESLGLNKRCSGFCLKCDWSIQSRYDSASEDTRIGFVKALASLTREDCENPRPIFGLVTLLSALDFDRFISRLAEHAPFDAPLAWGIIRLAAADARNWFMERGTAPFQRQFHLHPTIAPLLIDAVINADPEEDAATALLDYFAPIASSHPNLMQALPRWHANNARQEAERHAEYLRRQEQQRLEEEENRARRAAREAEFEVIEWSGPIAVINAVLAAPTLKARDCPERWAKLIEAELNALPRETLKQLARMFKRRERTGHWKTLPGKVRHQLAQANAQERNECLSTLAELRPAERLQAACDSRWSLSYFPDQWAEELIREPLGVSEDLRTKLLTKLMRFRRRSPWRTVRNLLLH